MDKDYQSRLDAIDKLVDLLKEYKLEVTYNDEVLFLGTPDEEIAFFAKAKEIISESSDYHKRLGRLSEQVLFTDYYSAAVDNYVQMNQVITHEGHTIDNEQLLKLRKEVEINLYEHVQDNTDLHVMKDDDGRLDFVFTTDDIEYDIKIEIRDIIRASKYFEIMSPIEGDKKVYNYFYSMLKSRLYQEMKESQMEQVVAHEHEPTLHQVDFIEVNQHGIVGYGVDQEDNRFYIKTDGKPSQEIRNMIKTAGLRWTPSKVRWQRQITHNAITSLKSNLFEPLGLTMDIDSLQLETVLKTAENDVDATVELAPNPLSQEMNESLAKVEMQRTIYENENAKLLNLMRNPNWSGIEKQIDSQQTIVAQEFRRLQNASNDHIRKFASIEDVAPIKSEKVLSDLPQQKESDLAIKLEGKAKDIDMQDVFDELKEGVKQAFENPVQFKALLDFSSTAQNYSLNNILLLQSQIDSNVFMADNPVITNTYNGWQEQGITVNRGEKALKIIKPGTFKAFQDEKGIIKSINHATDSEKQLIKDGKLEVFEKNYFRLKAEVFLYTQTDADISKLFADRIVEHPDAGKLYEQIKEQTQALGVQVLERNIGMPAGKAVDHGNSKLIIINDQLNDAHKLKTLIHEIAHIETHFDNNDSTLNTKELEAEASAYLTCKELGIDTSDYSFNYLASWSKDKEVKELTQAFTSIKKITLNIKEKYIIKNESINNDHTMKEHDTGFKQTAKLSNHVGMDVEL